MTCSISGIIKYVRTVGRGRGNTYSRRSYKCYGCFGAYYSKSVDSEFTLSGTVRVIGNNKMRG